MSIFSNILGRIFPASAPPPPAPTADVPPYDPRAFLTPAETAAAVQPLPPPLAPSARAMEWADPQTVDVMARTIWGEARGEGRPGMEAVASVIINRAVRGGWWGSTPVQVCQKPWQFSCWNVNDPNLPQLRAVNGSDPTFTTAELVAQEALLGHLRDPTGGADSYYALSMSEPPNWAAKATKTATIGNQVFFRTV